MAARVPVRPAARALIALVPAGFAPIVSARPGPIGLSGRIASRLGRIGLRARRDSSRRLIRTFPFVPSPIDPSAPCVRYAPIDRSGRSRRALDSDLRIPSRPPRRRRSRASVRSYSDINPPRR